MPPKNCEKQMCDFFIDLTEWRGKTGKIEIIDGSNEAEIMVDNFSLE